MGKYSYWSDKAIDDKAKEDVSKGVFDQPAGWLGKTWPGDQDYDRYVASHDYHTENKDD